MKLLKNIAALAFCGLGMSAQAKTTDPIPTINDNWRFAGTISGWAPASWTTSTVRNLSKSADSTIDQNLNSAGGMAMFTLEAHKGNWGAMADLVYWQIGGSGSTTYYLPRSDGALVGGYNAKQTQSMLTIAGTYTAYKSPALYLDGLLGARYISATTTVAANIQFDGSGNSATASGYPSYTNQTTDPVVGFKGRARIMDSSWFVPFYADAGKGPGSTNTTWQALIGIGDAFSWGDVTLAYRTMGFDLKSNIGVTNYTNAGPQLSATINF